MFTYVCIGCDKVKMRTRKTFTIVATDGDREITKRYCCPKCTELLDRMYDEHLANPLRGTFDD